MTGRAVDSVHIGPWDLPSEVVIREVGPRDGLQSEAPMPAQARARLILALLAAGVKNVEAVSFVSPKAVPAMADPREVLDLVGRVENVKIAALVPNLKGAQMALDAEVDEITVTIAASPAYNLRNVRMSIDESLDEIAGICSLGSSRRVRVDVVVSCAFGSPYEGDIPPADVSSLVARLVEAGASAITLADTTGMGTPRVLHYVLSEVKEVLGNTPSGSDLGLHLHDTRGTALVNCFTAMAEGIRRFDASVGGMGGSPFADGAAGNVSTEDLVALLDDLGIATGIDLVALLRASTLVEELVGHRLESRVAYSGPRSRVARAKDAS
jgi:hydroxymethylglutaryl-CoA lyase